jgi:hypothetical protein
VDEHQNAHARLVTRERENTPIYMCEHKGGEIQRIEIEDVI